MRSRRFYSNRQKAGAVTASPLHIRKGRYMRLYTEAALCRALGISKNVLRAYVKSGAVREGKTERGLFILEIAAREIIAEERRKEHEVPDYATERAKLGQMSRK